MNLSFESSARIRPLALTEPSPTEAGPSATAAALLTAREALTVSLRQMLSLFDAHRLDLHAFIRELAAIDVGLARRLEGSGA